MALNFAGVWHRAQDNFAYALNEELVEINLNTGYDVDEVYLIWGDPFKRISREKRIIETDRLPMDGPKKLAHHKRWSAVVKPPFKRVSYYFELHAGGEIWNYMENGFIAPDDLGKVRLESFKFPWLNPIDICRHPAWVKDTIWYQIFPERFRRGGVLNADALPDWEEGVKQAKRGDFYGGDLRGITEKIPYIRDLGANGLYLNPIFEAPSNHKYDTVDYLKIDPNFGINEDFRDLVDAAHRHGIRVMIDGVFNHSGRFFAPWQDVLKNGPRSKYWGWFMVNKWPFDQRETDTMDGKFYSFAFGTNMPKLNSNNPEVIEYVIDVCEKWVEWFDIDGIRFDVASEDSHRLWKDLWKRLKAKKPDIYLMAEIWHDSMPWLRGDEFDSVMNYPLTYAINNFFLQKDSTKLDFEHGINRCYTMYMRQSNDALFNLLDSHDTQRLRRTAGSDACFYQQLAILFTMAGSPCIYYGTEVLMDGADDPDCRRCMPWKQIAQGAFDEEIGIVSGLLKLRHTVAALKSQEIIFTNELEDPRVIEYIKRHESGDVQVIVNGSGRDVALTGGGETLFSLGATDQTLKKDGVLIRKIK